MARLNIEVVQQAIVKLVQANEHPSNERIINQLGYGSKSTLTKLRAKYPTVFDGTVDGIVNADRNTDSSTDNGAARFTTIETKLNLVLDRLDHQNSEGQATRQMELEKENHQLKLDLKAQKEMTRLTTKSAAHSRTEVESLETKNNQLKREILSCKNEAAKEVEDVLMLRSKNEKMTRKINNQSETIVELNNDIRRLKEANEGSERRTTEAKNEREKASKIASDYEAALERIKHLEKNENLEPVKPAGPVQLVGLVQMVGPEVSEPEIKFTLDEAHERFDDLCEQYPEKKQSELVDILDSEGYKNSLGKEFTPSTISRWYNKVLSRANHD